MELENALVFLYTPTNKYSCNALVGALETDAFFDDLKIYFPSNEKTFLQVLETIVKQHKQVVAAFSFMTPQFWKTALLVKKLRKKFGSRIFLIAGGPHPSGDLQGTLNMGFDVAVQSEGEASIIDLLKHVYTGGDIQKIPGIALVQDDGQIKFTEKRQPIHLDHYPPFAVQHKKIGPLEVTRGCPFRCHYCQTGYLTGSKPRHRSVDFICAYVDIMKSNHLKDIRFISPNAFSYGSEDGKTLNLNALENLLKNIRKILGRDGRFFWGTCPSEVRPEHVNRETLELIVRYANNDNLIIGAQSGSQRLLDVCNRTHSVADIYRAVELILDAGLKANVDFIFGLPGETSQDLQQTIRVMQDLAQKGAKIHAHSFMPLPQTPFFDAPIKTMDAPARNKINHMASHGLIYGNWIRQEAIAKRIQSHFRTRPNRTQEILDRREKEPTE